METEIRSRGSERAGECIALRRQRCFVARPDDDNLQLARRSGVMR